MGIFSHDVKILPRSSISLFNIYPCWDCPGLVLNNGEVAEALLCQNGTRQPLTAKQKTMFKKWEVQNIRFCCVERDCKDVDVTKRPMCRTPADTNCVFWKSTYDPIVDCGGSCYFSVERHEIEYSSKERHEMRKREKKACEKRCKHLM